MHLRLLPLLACALLAGGCSIFDRSTKVVLASDPPGARVLIDDKDSGFVTPCVLELDPADDARVVLELPGFEPARRLLVSERDAQAVLWRDMYLSSRTWTFPIWLDTRHFFQPIAVDRRLVPGRVFVRLERTADK